jgi:hypothetical protein
VAVDVFGDLNVPRGLPRAHSGRRNPGVESDCALLRLVFREPSVGDRKSAPRRLGLEFLDSFFSLTLFGPSTFPHPFLAAQPLAVSAPFTLRHLSDHQPRQKTKDLSYNLQWFLSFIVSPLSIRIFIIFGGKRTRRESCAR